MRNKKILKKAIFAICFLAFIYLEEQFLYQIVNLGEYTGSSDVNAMGNRAFRIVESVFSGRMLYLWHLLFVATASFLAFYTVRILEKYELFTNLFLLPIVHFLLYGFIFVSYNDIHTTYTNYGFGNINLSFFNQLLILAVELAGIMLILYLQKQGKLMNKYFYGKGSAALLLICLYSSFAIVGNSLFMSHPDKAWEFRITEITIYLLFAIWVLPYVLGILSVLEYRGQKECAGSQIHKRKVIVYTFFEAALISFLYLIACNPGNMYVDAIDALYEIMNSPIQSMSVAFPKMIKIFYKPILTFIPNTVVITGMQIILSSIMQAYVAYFFWKRGVTYKKIAIGILVFGILPPNGIFIVTFTSNFYYTIACLCMFFTLVKSSEEGDAFWTRPRHYLLLLAELLFMATTRNEGMVAAALIALVLLIKITMLFRKKLLWFYVVLLVTGAVFAGSGTLSKLLSTTLSAYATVNADSVNAVAHFDGDLSETTEYIEAIKSEYSEYEVGFLSRASFANNQPDRVAYALIHNPEIMLRNRLNKSDCLWDVLENEGIHTAREIIGIYKNDMGVTRQNNILTVVLIYILYPFTIAFCVLDVLFYRSGIYLILSFILAFYWSKNRMKRGLLLLPAWTHAFVLFLCLLWQCSRHTYPIIVCVVLAFLYTLVADRTKENSEVPIETV